MFDKPTPSTDLRTGGKDEDLSDWTKVSLKFTPELGKVSFFHRVFNAC